MKEFIPLIHTGIWLVFSSIIVIVLRKEIRQALNIITERLKSGSNFKIGTLEVGELKFKEILCRKK